MGRALGRHPRALLRSRLDGCRVVRAVDLLKHPSGKKVRIAGLVTIRQRPDTAAGVMFCTLEDETGLSNLVIWERVQIEQRRQCSIPV